MRLATKDDDDAGWAKCPLCAKFVVVVCERTYYLAKRLAPPAEDNNETKKGQ